MKLKSIVLAFLCMLLLAGCTDDSSLKKAETTKAVTTTTYKNDSFEATVLQIGKGQIGLIESDYVIDSSNGKIGEARLRYDDSVKVPSDIKKGDKIKVTVWGDGIGMKESSPPIIYDVKSIEKIS